MALNTVIHSFLICLMSYMFWAAKEGHTFLSGLVYVYTKFIGKPQILKLFDVRCFGLQREATHS